MIVLLYILDRFEDVKTVSEFLKPAVVLIAFRLTETLSRLFVGYS